MISSLLSVVTLSVPETESVTEGDVMVEVCATLSGVSTTAIVVDNIMLATSDGRIYL